MDATATVNEQNAEGELQANPDVHLISKPKADWSVRDFRDSIEELAGVEAGTVVDYDYVMANSLAKQVKDNSGLKVLGSGELTNALTVKAAKFSASAKEAIEKAGGTAETL